MKHLTTTVIATTVLLLSGCKFDKLASIFSSDQQTTPTQQSINPTPTPIPASNSLADLKSPAELNAEIKGMVQKQTVAGKACAMISYNQCYEIIARTYYDVKYGKASGMSINVFMAALYDQQAPDEVAPQENEYSGKLSIDEFALGIAECAGGRGNDACQAAINAAYDRGEIAGE